MTNQIPHARAVEGCGVRSPLPPRDFCPAAALAQRIAELDAYLDLVMERLEGAAVAVVPQPAELLRCMEAHVSDVIMALEAARAELAHAQAVSPMGVIVQLLGAMRDVRCGDEDSLERARVAEARASAFVEGRGMLDYEAASRLRGYIP